MLLIIIHINSNTICLSDVSHMSRTIDLHNRGQRTILVKCGSAIVSNAVARDYSQVIDANPIIVNSLTPKSVPAGAKKILFGRYVLNIYVGIVRYFLRTTKLSAPKSTYRHNAQIGEYRTIFTSRGSINYFGQK